MIQKVLHRIIRLRKRLLKDLRQRRHAGMEMIPLRVQFPKRRVDGVCQIGIRFRSIKRIYGTCKFRDQNLYEEKKREGLLTIELACLLVNGTMNEHHQRRVPF
jgi:hypothetical protein